MRYRKQYNHRYTGKDDLPYQLELAAALVGKLERLSADSIWAHRASGVRGALLKSIDTLQARQSSSADNNDGELQRLAQAMDYGYWVLEKAARELIE